MLLVSIQDKDKKKGKGKNKAANNNKKDQKENKEEKQKDQATANAVQTMAEAKMAASSIVANSKTRNTDNVTVPKSDVKKEPRKPSLAGIKSNAKPTKLPPIEQQKKTNPSSKEAVPRRKITPQGPPQVIISYIEYVTWLRAFIYYKKLPTTLLSRV